MRVEFSHKAREDLAEIAEYLHKFGFDPNIVFEIKQEISAKLTDNPLRGAIYKKDIHKVLILRRKNVVFYRVDDHTVTILHVRAGRQSKNI
jgi:addiction module RelE/StbE family toxin